MEPPPPGVRPVRREDSFGVGKLPRKPSSKYPGPPVGPASIAGLNGPERREPCQPGVPPMPSGAGEVRLATEGRAPTNLPGVSAGLANECSNGLGSSEK